jgi:transposase
MEEGQTAGGRRRWVHWTEEQARAALDELSRSGTSIREFAQSKGVSTQRIAYWKKRLAEGGSTTFVAVPMPTMTRPAGQSQIEIAIGDVAIRVREDLEVEHLARIVGALARRMS